jgi:hypothetical protein
VAVLSMSILPKCPKSELASGEHELGFYDPTRGTCSWCGQAAARCPECGTLAGLHHDPACTRPCGPCEDRLRPLRAPWRWFRTAADHVFYRCGACGTVLDWRDHELHLRWHGIAGSEQLAELARAQEEYVGLRKLRLP